MNLVPHKIFMGLIDFFSILLPGAPLTYLLMDDVGQVVLDDRCTEISLMHKPGIPFSSRAISSAIWSFCSERGWTKFYDWTRGYTLNVQNRRLALRGKSLSMHNCLGLLGRHSE